jgi:DnaJ like chaperone protein
VPAWCNPQHRHQQERQRGLAGDYEENMIGRLLGTLFGFMLARFVGAVVGFLIGWWFDKSLQQALTSAPQQGARQQQFLVTFFEVLGHLAKSKGRVTSDDIQFASQRIDELGLTGDARQAAMAAFNRGKQADYQIQEQVQALRQGGIARRDLLNYFLGQVIIAALLDGQLEAAEYEVIRKVAAALGVSKLQLDMMLQMTQARFRFEQHQQQSYQSQAGSARPSAAAQLADAYAVLGVDRSASAAEVKRAYRKLMAKHHPDKLAAQGLPPEMRASAQQKAQQIQAAYELIKQAAQAS